MGVLDLCGRIDTLDLLPPDIAKTVTSGATMFPHVTARDAMFHNVLGAVPPNMQPWLPGNLPHRDLVSDLVSRLAFVLLHHEARQGHAPTFVEWQNARRSAQGYN